MNYDILKKYSAPVKSIESSSDAHEIIGNNYTYNITHTSMIENENYKMKVGYTDGCISYMDVTAPEVTLHLNDRGVNRFLYHVPSDSDFEKKGIGIFNVSSKNNMSMNIEKFCSRQQQALRFFKGIRTTAVIINNDFLFDSPNKTWLQEHGLYDNFVDAQNLLDTLSELCIGNQITENQLVSLMETGELFRSQEERIAYTQKLAELQKKADDFDKKINESISLENELNSTIACIKKQRESVQLDKKALYDDFIRDEEI